MRIFLFALCALTALAGCEKRPAQTAEHGAAPPPPAEAARAETKEPRADSIGEIDASKLLTSSEIKSVLGEPLKEPVASYRAESGFAISQCYFGLPTPSRSVVVTVTRRGAGGDALDPRAFWQEKFHPGAEGVEKNAQGDAEEERPATPPQRIEGVGEEAYWAESGQMGALYVLRGREFLRLAIGGSDDQETKIRKSSELARLALKRL